MSALQGADTVALPLPAATAATKLHSARATERVHAVGRAAAAVAADVSLLVSTVSVHAVAAAAGTTVNVNQPGAGAASLEDCLELLTDPDVLALATDSMLADLLDALRPLLRYTPAAGQWGAPGLGAALGPLQQSCQASGACSERWLPAAMLALGHLASTQFATCCSGHLTLDHQLDS